jgi:hypothetical protein
MAGDLLLISLEVLHRAFGYSSGKLVQTMALQDLIDPRSGHLHIEIALQQPRNTFGSKVIMLAQIKDFLFYRFG